MNKISDFFTRSTVGNLFGISLIYGFIYLIIQLLHKTGFFFNNIFRGIFKLSKKIEFKFDYIIDKIMYQYPQEGNLKYWYTESFYKLLIISIVISFIFTVICYLLCNSKTSIGKDRQPIWWLFTVILSTCIVIGGIIWTPLLYIKKDLTIYYNAPIFFTWVTYLIIGYLPFYISTVLFCGTTAKGAYTIKKLWS